MDHVRLGYRFCRLLCRWTSILLLRVRFSGQEHVPLNGGVLLVSNHQSFMDPVLATIAMPREGHYMARDSLFRNKWFGGLIRYLNAFPVRRGTADLQAIKESMRKLKDGRVVVVFPEGTRTPDGRIGPLLAGPATMAKKCNVPIVPVVIDGVFQAWPRHQILPGIGDVVVQYGAPMLPDEYSSMTPDELTEEIRRRMLEMQAGLHRRMPARRLEWYEHTN